MKQISNSTSTERESDQNLILKLPRKPKQHLMALHFRRPHRSRTGVPCNTSNSDSALTSRCLSDPNLSQCQIKWSTVSLSCRHTHIAPSTIPNLSKCDRTELCPEIILDTEVTKLLSSFRSSNHGRSDTIGRMEWPNRPLSAKSHLLCHSLNKTGLAKPWKSHVFSLQWHQHPVRCPVPVDCII
jgi:hypothetical protein